MSKKNLSILALIFFVSILVRLINLPFPAFTPDEARIAYRGYTLALEGRDEFGRKYPILFNSLSDYQLPAVSYITALGIGLFGKSDFGARMPFVIFGSGLAVLICLVAQLLGKKKATPFISALLIAFSPTLIFLSRVPNEAIVLTFLFTLIFYLLIKKTNSRIDLISILLLIITAFFTSKHAWFILIPFIFFTLYFYQKDIAMKKKTLIFGFTILTTIMAILFFLNIPQAKRSLSENNFSIFSNVTIANGINKLRGQGLESGWPNLLERILFNKSHFLISGFLHWFSNLQPRFYFGQFDEQGLKGFTQQGAFPKILIIPGLLGFIYIIQKGQKREKLLPVYFLILTFPAIFVYPLLSQELITLTLPIAAFIIASGFIELNKKMSLLIATVVVLELLIALFYLDLERMNTNFKRPGWIKEISKEVFVQSINNPTAISDDIVEDVISFIEWYNPVNIHDNYFEVPSPYKFRQQIIKNIRAIGADNQIVNCLENNRVFASNRDLKKITHDSSVNFDKVYYDSLNQQIAFRMESKLCIR